MSALQSTAVFLVCQMLRKEIQVRVLTSYLMKSLITSRNDGKAKIVSKVRTISIFNLKVDLFGQVKIAGYGKNIISG